MQWEKRLQRRHLHVVCMATEIKIDGTNMITNLNVAVHHMTNHITLQIDLIGDAFDLVDNKFDWT
eukprot:11449857-Ditylum_brightwellii.AAC.1